MILAALRCDGFVGRREELAFLHEEFSAAAGGRPRFVPIEGEAGIGKSRLVDEFVAEVGDAASVATGQCSEQVRSPYQAFASILRTRKSNSKKASFFEEALAQLIRAGKPKPVIIVIEDLQWADSASIELLAYLVHHLRSARILILAVIRTETTSENPALSALRVGAFRGRANILRLHGLRQNEVRTLAGRIARERDGIVAPEDFSQIEILSDGNPLFVEELVRMALDTGRLTVEAHVPVTIEAMVNERIAPLCESERTIIVRAAIVGQRFDARFLSKIVELPIGIILAAMQHAVDAGILVASATSLHEFAFRHALIRQTLADRLILGLAAPLHLRIAEELQALPDADDRVAELAFHWSAARVPDRARYYNERAGEAATALCAYRDGIGFYSAALRWDYPQGAARAAVFERLGTLLYIDGCGGEPAAWFQRCFDEYASLHDAAGMAHASILLADQYWVDARTGESLEAASRAAGLLDASLQPRMLAEALLCLARFSITLGDAIGAQTHLQKAATLQAHFDVGLRASFFEVGAETSAALGDTAKALRQARVASELARESGISELIAQVENNHALLACDLGEIDLAIERHKIALAEAHRTSMMWRVAYSALNYAMTLMTKGDLREARALVAISLESGVTTATFKTKIASVGIPLALMMNDHQLLRQCSGETALEAATVSSEPQRIASVRAAFAELRFSQGEDTRGSALLTAALADLTHLHRGWNLVAQVALHGSQSDRLRAKTMIRNSSGRARVVRAFRLLFEALDERERDRPRAIRLAGLAAQAFEASGMVLYRALALETADEQTAALAIYAAIGSIRDVERLRLAPPPNESPSVGVLSARQLEIANLVAEGDSNRMIATRLHISENTVEHHLSGIFQRLGLRSRSQLAARIVDYARR